MLFDSSKALTSFMVVGWGRESRLGPAEISFFCSWFNFRMRTQGESKISSSISDMNQKNKELQYQKVGSTFSCEIPGIGRFVEDLPRTVRRENVLWKWL